MVQAYIGGLAARSETYMRAHWDQAKGLRSDAELAAAADDEERAWLGAQQQAGLSPVSPAYVRWEDILRPLTACAGIEAGPLTRTFETNTFHRQPIVAAAPGLADPASWRVGLHVPDDGWILSLPSPYDALVRSDLSQKADADEAIAAILNAVARDALSAGAARVRFQEPSALYARHDVDVKRLGDTLAAAAKGIEAKSILHLTQGDPFARPDVLTASPCRGLSLPPSDRDRPAGTDLGGHELSVAVVHGEQSLLEDPGRAGEAAARFAAAAGAPLWGVTNGWDLEHVPQSIALRKLPVLAEAAKVAARAVEVAA